MARGSLIVFEGLDGCGKSTQLALLREWLEARGHDCVTTREPTDGPFGQRIRAMARSGEQVAPEVELSWFVEDRREHVAKVIEPGLERGASVLCDRYWLSTVAYQGARGHDAAEILRQSEADFPVPDLALIFEISPEEGIARVNARGGVAEPVFEQVEFQREVKKIFDSLERPWIERVDARGSIEQIHAAVVAAIEARGLANS